MQVCGSTVNHRIHQAISFQHRHTSDQLSPRQLEQVPSVLPVAVNANVNHLLIVSSKFKRCLFSTFRPFIVKTLFVIIHCRRGRHWTPCKVRALVLLGSLVLAVVVTAIVVTLTSMQHETSTSTTTVTGTAISVTRLAIYPDRTFRPPETSGSLPEPAWKINVSGRKAPEITGSWKQYKVLD
jgi:hypothetical protein